MFYLIDHYYVTNHLAFCHLVRSNRDIDEACDILSAVLLTFGTEMASDEIYKKLDDEQLLSEVVRLLVSDFGFEAVNKRAYTDEIEEILDQEWQLRYATNETWDFISGEDCTYIDLFKLNDNVICTGRKQEIMDKWITDGIREKIQAVLQ